MNITLRQRIVNWLTLHRIPLKLYRWMCYTSPVWECKHKECKPNVANPGGICLWDVYDIRPYV